MSAEIGKGVIGLGSTIGIGPSAATTGTATYVTIGQVIDAKPSGAEKNVIKYSLLNGGRAVAKLAGISDAGTLELEIARLATDAGQVALVAAYADQTGQPYKFQIQLPIDPQTTPAQTVAGDVLTFNAIVSKYNPLGELAADKMQMLTVTLDLVTDFTIAAGS